MRVQLAPASKRNSIWSVIVPADGTRTATVGERRLRNVADFWAVLGQAAACLYSVMWGVGRKEQWRVEKLGDKNLRKVIVKHIGQVRIQSARHRIAATSATGGVSNHGCYRDDLLRGMLPATA